MMTSLCKDPFRLYFPFAILTALYASSLWISYVFMQSNSYPGFLHAELFIGGFLYFSIFGFLMTALPRFTQTHFATPIDIFFSAFLILAILSSSLLKSSTLFWFFIFIGWPFLISFAAKRFAIRKQNPPFTFLFVGLGLLLGALGSFLILIHHSLQLDTFQILSQGKVLFYDGMVLSLILGIGGRLIPGILGFKEIVSKQREVYEKPIPFLKVIPKDILLAAPLFLLSLILEGYLFFLPGYLLRALIISYIAFKYWNIHKWPTERKWHGIFLIVSCWFIVIASWLLIVFINHAISIKHLIYIGGYSLITLLVASRVILAHGNSGLELEYKHFPYSFFGSILALAALTRAVAPFIPDSYLNHLGYTGFSFIIGTLIWSVVFLPKLKN